VSTHSEPDDRHVDTANAPSPDVGNATLTPADIELDARIAAYLESGAETIAQAEALLIESQALFDESGLDLASVMSRLSPAERAQLNEMTAEDEAEIEKALMQAKAAQAFSVADRKDVGGMAGAVRRGRLFI